MPYIGLLSDTHGHLDPKVFEHFADCDEIWHAGDIGSPAVSDALAAFKPLRAVHGNIDGQALRRQFPEDLHFECGGLRVWLTHIGGYPGRYSPRTRARLQADPPGLFVCGHSHILRVMPDPRLGLLHMNPGACGLEGFHQVRTLLRFRIEAGRVQALEAIELAERWPKNS